MNTNSPTRSAVTADELTRPPGFHTMPPDFYLWFGPRATDIPLVVRAEKRLLPGSYAVDRIVGLVDNVSSGRG